MLPTKLGTLLSLTFIVLAAARPLVNSERALDSPRRSTNTEIAKEVPAAPIIDTLNASWHVDPAKRVAADCRSTTSGNFCD
ncbi:hypothetical protein C8J57DRAFT_1360523 [Mycena rebaudengoi]|nr:hypothetical protein C8J57DRAFT_1360523 [Mycena rebaudengoi]